MTSYRFCVCADVPPLIRMVCVEQTTPHTPCCGECNWLDPLRNILPDLHPLSALNLLLCRKLKHGALIWPPEPQRVLVCALLRHLINRSQVHLHDYPSVNCVWSFAQLGSHLLQH